MSDSWPVYVVCVAIISSTFSLSATAMASENSFVFVSQADSTGSDYLRVGHSSFEDCAGKCDAQSLCNAFTYNQRRGVCFLKHSANRAIAFYAFAITGVKLSPGLVTTTPSDEAESFFVIPRADSPGNDSFRITLFTYEECQHNCEADKECNAFTYNQARSVCFLKRAVTKWTNFSAWAITGIKLSSLQANKGKAATTTPAEPAQPASPAIPQSGY